MIGVAARVFTNAAIKGAAAVVAIIVQLMLVRNLGASGYGTYAMYLSAISLASIFAKCGADVSITRLAAVIDPSSLRSLRGRAILLTFLLSLGSALVLYALKGLTHLQTYNLHVGELVWGVAFMTAGSVLLGLLRGLGLVLQADLIDGLLRPAVLLLLVLIASELSRGYLSPESRGIWSYVVASALVVTCLWLLAERSFTHASNVGGNNRLTEGKILAIELVPAALASYALFQMDTLLLAFVRTPVEVGAYSVACSYARAVIFMPMIIGAQMSRSFAQLAHASNWNGFHLLVGQAVRQSLLFAIPIAAAVAACSFWILKLTTPEYEAYFPALVILSAAHCFNAAAIIYLGALSMAGEYRKVLRVTSAAAVVGLVANVLLQPSLGALGASLSATASLLTLAFLSGKACRGLR